MFLVPYGTRKFISPKSSLEVWWEKMKLWKGMINLINRLTDWMFFCAICLLVAIALFVLFEIVMRQLFGWGLDWVMELIEYLLAYLTFLGAAYLLKNDNHITFDLLIQRLSVRKQAFLRVIANLLGFLVTIIITYFGTITTMDLFQRGIVTETVLVVPKGLLTLPVAFSMLFLTFQFLSRLFTAIDDYRQIGKRWPSVKGVSAERR